MASRRALQGPPPPTRALPLPPPQVNEAHPPRAADLAELHSLQKTRKERGEALAAWWGRGCTLRGSPQPPMPCLAPAVARKGIEGLPPHLRQCLPHLAGPPPARPFPPTPLPPPSLPPCLSPADDTAKTASLTATLKSGAREVGPRVVVREPKHLYLPQSPRSRAAAEEEQTDLIKEMFHEMGDIGLKPVVVYHNLRWALWGGVGALAWGGVSHARARQRRKGLGAGSCARGVSGLRPQACASLLQTPARLHACTSPLASPACRRHVTPQWPPTHPPSSPCPSSPCSVPELYEHALKYEPSTHIVASGALATLSGAKTGRSPK